MDAEELRKRFTYHPPKPERLQAETYEQMRSHALTMATFINRVCPESREKSLAITNLEETVMWANAAIARHG
jgi:hypothetical protein